MLGYHASARYEPPYVWGASRPVKLWQGIVIPWIYQGNVWRLTIRDEQVASGNGRYRQVSGGSNGLYLADSLALQRPIVVMTEGEFDALSVAQVCGKQVAVVATGTTQGGHTPRWIALLAHYPRVLIAFDGERTGDHAASWWLQRLQNAQRLRPLWKDANQMLQDGADLRAWVETSSTTPVMVVPPAQGDVQDRGRKPQRTPLCQACPSLLHLTEPATFLAVVVELTQTYRIAPRRLGLDL